MFNVAIGFGVFALFPAVFAAKESDMASCGPLADVLFRHHGHVYLHLKRSQYFCSAVAHYNDAEHIVGALCAVQNGRL